MERTDITVTTNSGHGGLNVLVVVGVLILALLLVGLRRRDDR